MYRSILIPLDGSTFAEQALPAACAIAQRARTRLCLVHVHLNYTPNPISIPGMPVIDRRLNSLGRDHERAYLAHVRDRLLVEQPGIEIATRLLEPVWHNTCAETVAGALAAYVPVAAADLVVMTTHGRGGFTRFWLGSVATALAERCPAPLLLVRPGAAGVVAYPSFRRILIPLDGSKAAERMVYRALMLGRLLATDYVLLRVVEPAIGTAPFVIDRGAERTTRLRAEAQDDLDRVANWMRIAGAIVSAHVRVAPNPAHTILETAEEAGADVIAMATHIYNTGRHRSMHGSITDTVVCHAHLPVLIYATTAPCADEATHSHIRLH